MNDKAKNIKKLDSDKIHRFIPKLDNLEPGQTVIIFLRAYEIEPDWPRMDCHLAYTRIGDQLFRHLVEEVK